MSFNQLHLFALNGDTTSASKLFEDGGGEADLNTKDVSGAVALHKAAKLGHASFVKLLLDKVAQDPPVPTRTWAAPRCLRQPTPPTSGCFVIILSVQGVEPPCWLFLWLSDLFATPFRSTPTQMCSTIMAAPLCISPLRKATKTRSLPWSKR